MNVTKTIEVLVENRRKEIDYKMFDDTHYARLLLYILDTFTFYGFVRDGENLYFKVSDFLDCLQKYSDSYVHRKTYPYHNYFINNLRIILEKYYLPKRCYSKLISPLALLKILTLSVHDWCTPTLCAQSEKFAIFLKLSIELCISEIEWSHFTKAQVKFLESRKVNFKKWTLLRINLIEKISMVPKILNNNGDLPLKQLRLVDKYCLGKSSLLHQYIIGHFENSKLKKEKIDVFNIYQDIKYFLRKNKINKFL